MFWLDGHVISFFTPCYPPAMVCPYEHFDRSHQFIGKRRSGGDVKAIGVRIRITLHIPNYIGRMEGRPK